MSWDEAGKALLNHLANMTDVPDIAYENYSYEPTSGQTYVKEQLMPIKSDALTLNGNIARNDMTYQVLVYIPKDDSARNGMVLADKICTQFKAGTRLTNGSTTVEVLNATQLGGFNSDAWYCIPVRIDALYFG